MSDPPEYDISEMLLSGLFIAAGISYLIFAGYSYFTDEPFDALEGAGLSLLLLGGSVDPRKYLLDCLSFPFPFAERAGRDTRVTMVAAGLGLAMWVSGVVLNWLHPTL